MADKQKSRGQQAVDAARGRQKRDLTERIAQAHVVKQLHKELAKKRKKSR